MRITITCGNFLKLLQYPDSIAVRIEKGILTATSKLKGLETMVSFGITADEDKEEFFAVTMTAPAHFFKVTKTSIDMEIRENSIILSAGMMTVELPITRDILADFEIPPFDRNTCVEVNKGTRYSLRSMLSTLSDVAKAIMDYSGTTVRIKDGTAVVINNSMCLECATRLPDMCVSASAMLSMLSLTNAADSLLCIQGEHYITFATDDIVIRIPTSPEDGEFITADKLLKREEGNLECTEVYKQGLSDTLKALSVFRDATSASMVYNPTGIEFSMRGNGYNVSPSITGVTVFINPRVLVVLGKFLCADSYKIIRGGRYVCLSTDDRKLTIYASNY